jgi:hypothetical protein
MQEGKLDKAARFVDNWWKILSVGIAMILIIYQISVIWIKAKEMEQNLENLEHDIKIQNDIRDEKSDKRYQKTTEMYDDLTDRGIELTRDYQDHLIDDAYFRGKMDAEIDNLKNR